MAAHVVFAAPAAANGFHSAEDSHRNVQGFYDAILQLRDVVLARSHPKISLPQAKIDELKASLAVPGPPQLDGADNEVSQEHANGNAAASARITSHFEKDPRSTATMGSTTGKAPVQQGQPKRKRIEQEMVARVGQRKRARSSQDFWQMPATVLEEPLRNARALVSPVTGLRSRVERDNDAGSSFDENDYYSSLVESDWSSDGEVNPDKAADHPAGQSLHFTAEQASVVRDAPLAGSSSVAKPFTFHEHQALAQPGSTACRLHQSPAVRPTHNFDDVHDESMNKSEDDEYTPPPAAAFDSYRGGRTVAQSRQNIADTYEDSEYEPGGITAGSLMATPQGQAKEPEATSPRVPIVRNNHLTKIAAPQPNRVSPLATSQLNNDDYELALVNGCPELVPKQSNKIKQPTKRSKRLQEAANVRHSSTSPPAKKKGKKSNKGNKRKQEQENVESAKRRRQNTIPGSTQQDSYIKPEPTSPIYSNVPQALTYGQRPEGQAPAQVDLVSPRQAEPMGSAYEPASRAPYGCDSAPSAPSSRYGSPAPARYAQRDNQDLRRVASMQYAHQRPASPPQDRRYSPVGPYLSHFRQTSSTYRYEDQPARLEHPRGDMQPSPAAMALPRITMPPPDQPGPGYSEAPPRVIVDHNGVKYYATPAPPPGRTEAFYQRAPSRVMSHAPVVQGEFYETAPAPRASMAPPARPMVPESTYARAPSRATSVYEQPQHYAPADQRMAPPPPPTRRAQPVEYVDAQGYRVDAQGYRVREYSTRPAEPVAMSMPPPRALPAESTGYRYSPEPTSPAYQYVQREPAPPPQHEPTSPAYAPARSYSAVQDHAQRPAHQVYAPRQASVAPVQYLPRREMAPPPAPPSHEARRAVSVMPAETAPQYSYAHHAPAPPPQYAAQPREYSYSQAPPEGYQYVDEYGRVVQYQ